MFCNALFCFVVSDFNVVCDEQARAVKNSEADSQRHVIGLVKEGIASLDGEDSQNSEDAGNDPAHNVEPDQPCESGEAALKPTPNRKGKEKVGVSRASEDVPIFYANVSETPEDPASDLNPRVGRGKCQVEGIPDHITCPTKRASRVVQYMLSSDEEN